MKKQKYLILFFALFLISCNKEQIICEGELKSKSTEHISHCIDGKWKYLLRSGGFVGKTEELEDWEIFFDTENNNIQIFHKSNVVIDVTYTWLKDEDIFNEIANMIILPIIIRELEYFKMEILLQSIITCPKCGHKKEESMPTDACQYFYECKNCHTILKPIQGDCCVYCSYGTVKCPPFQQDNKCC